MTNTTLLRQSTIKIFNKLAFLSGEAQLFLSHVHSKKRKKKKKGDQ